MPTVLFVVKHELNTIFFAKSLLLLQGILERNNWPLNWRQREVYGFIVPPEVTRDTFKKLNNVWVSKAETKKHKAAGGQERPCKLSVESPIGKCLSTMQTSDGFTISLFVIGPRQNDFLRPAIFSVQMNHTGSCGIMQIQQTITNCVGVATILLNDHWINGPVAYLVAIVWLP